MVGTPAGGKKAAEKNKKHFGKDFYRRIGKIGGSAPKTKPSGFACDRARAANAAKKAGKVSKRGYKLVKKGWKTYTYEKLSTGELVKFKIKDIFGQEPMYKDYVKDIDAIEKALEEDDGRD